MPFFNHLLTVLLFERRGICHWCGRSDWLLDNQRPESVVCLCCGQPRTVF
jgi:hypothetical protein